MLTLTRMRMVAAIVKHGSMREAAEALTYSTPALSQQISRLERDLGLALFERVPRGVVPTVAGHRLAEIADQVVALVDAATVEMRDHADRVTGILRLGSFPSGSATIVPLAIERFLTAHPRAQVGLREAEPDDLIELLLTSQIDVALVYSYQLIPRELPHGVVERRLQDDPVHVLRPAGGSRIKVFSDLADQMWISTETGTAGAANLQLLCAKHGFVPTVRYRSNDYDVVQALVGAGLGLALVPGVALRASDDVEVVPVKPRPPSRTIKALHRSSDMNPLIEPLIDNLAAAVVSGEERVQRPRRPSTKN